MAPALVVLRKDEADQLIDPAQAPKDETNIATFLRSKHSTLRHREGLLNGQRVEYFKGYKAVTALLKNGYAHKSRPQVDTREEARDWIQRMMEQYNFFYRVKKSSEGKDLTLDEKQFFEEEAYFVWQWESAWTRIKTRLYSALLIVIVLAGVMFPLWPEELRVGVWYLSMFALSLLGALLGIAIVRYILYIVSLALPFTRPGFWLFPNLFADVGILDSFIPFWGWEGVDYETAHHLKYRQQQKLSRAKKRPAKKVAGASPDKGKGKATASGSGNESASSASPDPKWKGKGRMMEDSEPLLERRKVPLEKKSVDSDEDDVEEIEAEPRPKNV